MNTHDPHRTAREFDAQQRAVSDERAGRPAASDPTIACYRALHRAILVAPLPEPPAAFAAAIAAQVEHAQGSETLETLLQRLLLTTVAIAALVFSAPHLLTAALEVAAIGRDVSLALPLAAGIGIAVAGAIDRLARGWILSAR